MKSLKTNTKHCVQQLFAIFLFILLPVLFISIGFNYKHEVTHYSLNCVDPEMAYLYNGLTITHGHFPHFVDHPGIPLQYMSVAVIVVVHLFRDGSIDEDVILHPDLYLNAITSSFIFFNAIALFFLGLLTFKLFKSKSAGLFIQLTPFLSVVYLNLSNRVLPEFFALIIVAFVFLITIYYVKLCEEKNLTNDKKFPLLFAIMIGFAISTKITFLPFGLIPVLVLRTFREKLKFAFYSVFSLVFFLLPALNRWNYFSTWMKGLLLHSGQYGKGDTNVVDKAIFKQNLLEIYHNDPILIYLLVFLLIGFFIYFIPQLKLKQKKDSWFIAFIGFSVVTGFTVILIAKQMKLYYLSPAYVMAIPSLFLLLTILKRNKYFQKGLFTSAFLILTAFLSICELKPTFAHYESNSKDRQITQKVVTEKYANVPIANASNYYGSPFYGYSVHYGLAYSNDHRKKELLPLLMKLMPNFYSFHTWNNRFNYWDGSAFTLTDILKRNDSVYLYIGDEETLKRIPNESLGINRKMETTEDVVYANSTTSEVLIKIKRDAGKGKYWAVQCDLERRNENGENFIFENNLLADAGNTQCSEKSFSGKYSSKLNKDQQFGIGTALTDVEKGDTYTISVWKFNNSNQKSGLVVASVTQDKFYKIETNSVEEKSGWIKIQITVKVGEDLKGEDLKIYCWQADDEIPSYWDDFKIEKSVE